MRPFGATNLPGSCPWCGQKLGTTEDAKRKHYGPFDTLRCAEAFARSAHQLGFRFKPKEGK